MNLQFCIYIVLKNNNFNVQVCIEFVEQFCTLNLHPYIKITMIIFEEQLFINVDSIIQYY